MLCVASDASRCGSQSVRCLCRVPRPGRGFARQSARAFVPVAVKPFPEVAGIWLFFRFGFRAAHNRLLIHKDQRLPFCRVSDCGRGEGASLQGTRSQHEREQIVEECFKLFANLAGLRVEGLHRSSHPRLFPRQRLVLSTVADVAMSATFRTFSANE
jgi:hypothetical protein